MCTRNLQENNIQNIFALFIASLRHAIEKYLSPNIHMTQHTTLNISLQTPPALPHNISVICMCFCTFSFLYLVAQVAWLRWWMEENLPSNYLLSREWSCQLLPSHALQLSCLVTILGRWQLHTCMQWDVLAWVHITRYTYQMYITWCTVQDNPDVNNQMSAIR